ncbi:MAG: hypothetical protein HQM11_02305 [SAR324 cluster bacterium]|nr:hypothetical protein [SAR324 cluster bacterium]
MKQINLEHQINALYTKASQRKESQARKNPAEIASFGNTLKQTIENMHEISNEADNALKALNTSNTQALDAEIHQATLIHKRMMEVQHSLTALYKKIKIETKS